MSLPPDIPIPKQSQNIAQPKIVSEVSLLERSKTQDKFIPIPHARSGKVLKPKMINRECIRHISTDIPPHTDPFYRPPPDIPLQKFLRKTTRFGHGQ